MTRDTLSEALVRVPAGYFLGGETPIQGSESLQEFFQTYKNICTAWQDGRILWAAGLLGTGFTIELEPLCVDVPESVPEESLDQRLLMFNSYMVAPTLFDMGLSVTDTESSKYNEELTNFVLAHI